MTEILAKRRSLHRSLSEQAELNGQLQTQIGQMQSLANIGTVTAMIAHEMNNILTPLQNYAQLSLAHPEDSELATKALTKTVRNANRATKILQAMLDIAAGKQHEKGEYKLKELVDDIFDCIGRDFTKDRITVKLEFEDDLSVFANGLCFQQVLMNLILNAREAMFQNGGTLTISGERHPDAVWIEIADTGCGIDTEDLQNIFEPFFTTKTDTTDDANSGTGLGLAFCRKVLDMHNGTISVTSQKGQHTTFKLILPRF